MTVKRQPAGRRAVDHIRRKSVWALIAGVVVQTGFSLQGVDFRRISSIWVPIVLGTIVAFFTIEVTLSRRMQEIRGILASMVASGESFDGALRELRSRTEAKMDSLGDRIDRINDEIRRDVGGRR